MLYLEYSYVWSCFGGLQLKPWTNFRICIDFPKRWLLLDLGGIFAITDPNSFPALKTSCISMAWRLGICMSEGFLTHDHVGCLNVTPWHSSLPQKPMCFYWYSLKRGVTAPPLFWTAVSWLHCRKLQASLPVAPDQASSCSSLLIKACAWISLFLFMIAYDIVELSFRKFSKQYYLWHMDVSSNGGIPKTPQNDHFSKENQENPWLLEKPTI